MDPIEKLLALLNGFGVKPDQPVTITFDSINSVWVQDKPNTEPNPFEGYTLESGLTRKLPSGVLQTAMEELLERLHSDRLLGASASKCGMDFAALRGIHANKTRVASPVAEYILFKLAGKRVSLN